MRIKRFKYFNESSVGHPSSTKGNSQWCNDERIKLVNYGEVSKLLTQKLPNNHFIFAPDLQTNNLYDKFKKLFENKKNFTISLKKVDTIGYTKFGDFNCPFYIYIEIVEPFDESYIKLNFRIVQIEDEYFIVQTMNNYFLIDGYDGLIYFLTKSCGENIKESIFANPFKKKKKEDKFYSIKGINTLDLKCDRNFDIKIVDEILNWVDYINYVDTSVGEYESNMAKKVSDYLYETFKTKFAFCYVQINLDIDEVNSIIILLCGTLEQMEKVASFYGIDEERISGLTKRRLDSVISRPDIEVHNFGDYTYESVKPEDLLKGNIAIIKAEKTIVKK